MRGAEGLLLLLLAAPGVCEPPAIDRALDAELKRSMASLKQEGYPAPYYLSLTATDVDTWEARCPMGARGFSAEYHQRFITPDLRVGGYEMDNHPVAMPINFVGRAAGRDEDEFSLRHALWRMLDASYKSASADFLRKQALRVSRGKTEYDTDDLSREAPRQREASQKPSPWPVEALAWLCARSSGVFRSAPGLLHAEASVKLHREWSRLRDSEGSRVDFGSDVAELELEAVDISDDGLRQFASRRFIAADGAPLPDEAEVEAKAREMLADLKALKIAQTTSPFSAPALIDPSVSAAVVLSIGLRLSGEEQRNPSGAQTFRDKMGKPVLPASLSLEDDPTLASYGGKPLAGHFDYDDQGIPAQKAVLIEKGVLKGLLLSRYPVIGFPRSNGHARGLRGYMPEGEPGSLILRTYEPLSEGRLLGELRRECQKRGKAYGLWIRKLRAFTQQQGAAGHGSIRLMPSLVYLVEAETGKLTLVRDLDLVGTPLVMMSNILRAGDDIQVHNISLGIPVSIVTPSLLLSDAELQRAETKPEKQPILPPPAP